MAAAEESLTRVYTINLGKAWITPQYRRTDRVVNMIREFATRHMKANDIKLDQDLNRQVWSRGKTNPPRKLRVKMVKDEDGVVTVSLYEDLAPDAAVEPITKVEDTAEAEKKDSDADRAALDESLTTMTGQSKEEAKP
jgi:large subunit ribosomal protein L31e